MTFEPIASSSSGNCYRVSSGDDSLLLEAGLTIQQIKKAFDFQLSRVQGALITHEHADHSKAIKDILRAGIDVYMTAGTKEALGIEHHRIHVVEALKQFKIGSWTILPFDVQHDSAEPVGYLIMDASGEKLVFATDTYYLKYKFKGLSIIAVECNYSEEILTENIRQGITPVMMKKRLMQSHFSLENFKKFLQANDLSEVREIWLLHMSDRNSDADLFKREIQGMTGKPVFIP